MTLNNELPTTTSIDNMEIMKRCFLSMMSEVEQKEVVTLRVFVDEYQEYIKQNRSAAYSNSVFYSCKHLTDFFGLQKPIHTIGLKDVEQFLSSLQQKVPKGYSVYFRTLKSAFNKAVDWEYLKVNPFIKVKLPKKQKNSPAYINEKQLSLICNKINIEVIRNISILGFYTGMRLDELAQLTWRYVDLTEKIITVGGEDFETKSRKQRRIPICNEALEVLSKRSTHKHIQYNNKNYVFCKPGGIPFSDDYISKRFKSACRSAGIDKAIHFHSLRHSFASYLVQKGVSLYAVKELLGHSSISTTEIYAHLNMDSLKEATNTFNRPQQEHLANACESITQN